MRKQLVLGACVAALLTAATTGQGGGLTTINPSTGEWIKAIQDLRHKLVTAHKGVEESSWWMTEPFHVNSLADQLPPDAGVDMAAKNQAGNKPLWVRPWAWFENRPINLIAPDNSVVYLYHYFYADAPVTIEVDLRCACSLQLFLNKHSVLTHDKLADGHEKVKLELLKGKNDLLVKVFQAKTDLSEIHSFSYSSGPIVTMELVKLEEVYQQPTFLFRHYFPYYSRWLVNDSDTQLDQQSIAKLLKKFKNPAETARLDALIKAQIPSADAAWLQLFLAAAQKVSALEESVSTLKHFDFKALRLSIEDLAKTHPDRQQSKAAYLKQLEALEKAMPDMHKLLVANDGQAIIDFATLCTELQREALKVQSGELGFDEIVFVKRKPYSSGHYYTDTVDGTSADRFQPENGIYIYNLRTHTERPVVTAAGLPGGKGFIGKISLSFDAKKMVFDFRQDSGAGFRIWEVHTDGTGLRQVSFPPPDEAEKVLRHVWRPRWHTDDIHPCYLPDGNIIFASTRHEHSILCSLALDAAGLHRMNADGTHVEQLTQSPVSEFCPVVLDDGRVMYHRWEYVDRGQRVAKAIWTMNPDGTRSQELFGLSDDATPNYMYPQPIPGNNHCFVCVSTCHSPQGGCLGAIVLIDFGQGAKVPGPDPDEPGYVPGDSRYPVINLTPDVFVQRRTEPGWNFLTEQGQYVADRQGQHGHLYTHPFPVNDHEFLVSYKMRPKDHFKEVPNAYAMYLIDTKGHPRFVYADDKLSCWHPTPLVARPVPPQVKAPCDQRYAASTQACCFVHNIYDGMEGIRPGEVKWLRINEALPLYWSAGAHWSPTLFSSSWNAALWPRVQWGVVPVEKDGSAHFLVPANRNIFFQALDEKFRELQRERTYVNYRPGEVRSCTGCHIPSHRTATSNSSALSLALARPPSILQPQPCDLVANGGDGRPGQVIHYSADIQPIFNAKCIQCHGAKEPAGGLRLTGEVTLFYNTSYEELAKKELAGPIIPEGGSINKVDRGNYNGAYLPPKSLGCPKSMMMAILTEASHPKNNKKDHTKILTPMELMILSRWVDSNYQFYGSFFGRQHPQWVNADPKNPAYDPTDFRRRATFDEATSRLAPLWHR